MHELEIDATKERQKLDEILKEKQNMEAKIAPQVKYNTYWLHFVKSIPTIYS